MSGGVITGWKTGLQKIPMTKLIRACTGYDLTQGKRCVDKLLEGKVVKLNEFSDDQSERFVVEAPLLGAICHVETATRVLFA